MLLTFQTEGTLESTPLVLLYICLRLKSHSKGYNLWHWLQSNNLNTQNNNTGMTVQNEQNVNGAGMLMSEKSVTLFGPHSMDVDTHKTLSNALEFSLYALFVSFISIMLLLPNSPARIQAMFPNTALTDPIGFVLWIKMSLFIASLVPLFWGLHQSGKRLKGRLVFRSIR